MIYDFDIAEISLYKFIVEILLRGGGSEGQQANF